MHDREAADRLERERPTPDRPPGEGRRPSAASVLALQQVAGNAAVQRLVRGGPGTDPKFAALKRDVKGKQRRLTAHRPPRAEAAAAQGAAKPPADDKLAQGKVAQAGEMDAAKPAGFDKAAFIKAVNDAIAAQAPKNLDDADKFADSGKADHVKSAVQGKVSEGKKASAAQIDATTKAAPDTSKAVEKPVTPLAPDQPPPTPGGPDPAQAVPDKAPPSATDFSAGPREVNDQMAAAQVTDDQLARSNEPEFTDALKAKKDGEKHAATAPPRLRASEDRTLTAGRQQAAAAGQTAMAGMALHGRNTAAQLHAGKQSTQGGDEARRAAATARLQAVFDATKNDVEQILTGLDKKVDEQFTSLEGEARRAFTAEHKAKMDAYKDKRYSGFTGKLRWVKDKFAGLPEEANQIFVQARAGYVTRMQQVISAVADTIAAELTRAKARIAKGKADLAAEVNKLPADLKALGRQAATGFAAKFDELTDEVNSKGTELVNTLASKYTEALKSVDAEIEAEKEKNKGLIAKAVDAVKSVVDTILKLKDLLLGILAKAASAVMKILKDPIGFLGNLVHAVGAGLKDFIANIGEHLKKGLVSWLLGAAAQAGLQIPAKFDLKGILSLIGGLLGLTWSAIRGRVVSKGIPDQAVTAAEKAVPEAEALQKEGLPGLWQRVQARIGSLKDMILGKLAAFLIPTVLIAGITWIISLLNPASAFVKACKAIIDIVTFIVERGAQIVAFVNAVLDAVIAIAGGGTGGVPALIVGALAASIPVLIGFLAALLGVGGIADKVKKVFQAVSKPVMKVVDWVVDKIVGLAKKFWAKLKGKFGKGKDGKDKKVDPEKQRLLDEAMVSAKSSVAPLAGKQVPESAVKANLATAAAAHPQVRLTAAAHGGHWQVTGSINPKKTEETEAGVLDPKALRKLIQQEQLCRNEMAGIRDNLKPKGRAERKAPGQVDAFRADFAPVETDFEALGSQFKELRTGASVEVTVEEMTGRFEALKTRAAQLGRRIADAMTGSAEKRKSIETTRGQLNGIVQSAISVLADAEIAAAVLDNPRYAGLKPDIVAGRTTHEAFLNGHPLPDAAADDATLTALLDAYHQQLNAAHTLHSAVNRAKSLARPEQASRTYVKRIDEICTNTTKAGRPGADVGDGSSEAALEWEVENGKPYKSPEGHYLKVQDSITGLDDCVGALREIGARAGDPALSQAISEAITKATERLAGLRRGLAVWTGRGAHTDVWTAEGISKVTPGWPRH